MGFLSKLREGLGKTRSALMGGIESVMRSFVKIDEDFLEELEEILITSDVGVGASEEIIDELRERMDTYLGEFEQHGTDNITVEM